MKTQLQFILMILVTAVILTSCAKFPESEIQTAKNTIEKARSAGAEVYVKDYFTALEDSLNSVLLVLEQEKSKWFPNYKEGLSELTTIGTMAEDVVAKTESRKIEIREEIQSTLAQIQNLLAENNQLIASAPKGKEGTTALVQIKEELAVVQTAVDEASKMVENGDLIATQDKVNTAYQKANSINTELKDVIAKYNQARGRKS